MGFANFANHEVPRPAPAPSRLSPADPRATAERRAAYPAAAPTNAADYGLAHLMMEQRGAHPALPPTVHHAGPPGAQPGHAGGFVDPQGRQWRYRPEENVYETAIGHERSPKKSWLMS